VALTMAALKAEVQTDPAALGYAALVAARRLQGVADVLNFPRDGVAASPVNGVVGAAVSVKRADCTPSEILEAVDVRDFPAAPAGVNSVPLAQSWLESITQFPRVRLANADGTKTQVRKNIDRLVGNTNLSQDRLDAVAVRVGSRAELLFGFGVAVTDADVERALAS
jgi:hypothetical protein